MTNIAMTEGGKSYAALARLVRQEGGSIRVLRISAVSGRRGWYAPVPGEIYLPARNVIPAYRPFGRAGDVYPARRGLMPAHADARATGLPVVAVGAGRLARHSDRVTVLHAIRAADAYMSAR